MPRPEPLAVNGYLHATITCGDRVAQRDVPFRLTFTPEQVIVHIGEYLVTFAHLPEVRQLRSAWEALHHPVPPPDQSRASRPIPLAKRTPARDSA